MATSLGDIGSELTSYYPGATPKEISDAIIESIESEPMLRRIIKMVRLPDKQQIQLANLKSRRLPRKQAMGVRERVELVFFFERIKSSYIAQSGYASLPFISGNGAKPALRPTFPETSDANLGIKGRTSVKPDVGPQLADIIEAHLMEDQRSEPTKESMRHDVRESVVSAFILEEIRKRAAGKQMLSLDDISRIRKALEFVDEGVSSDEILELLDSDIKLRKKNLDVDCVAELYRGDDLLPPQLQTKHPEAGNTEELIYEKLTAIILHEYRRLHRQAGLDFINEKMTHDEYLERTQRYAVHADRLYPSQF